MEQAQRAPTKRALTSWPSPIWLGWLGVAVTSAGIALPGVIEHYRELANPPAEAIPALDAATITARAHAVYHTSIDVLFAIGAFFVAAQLLLRHRADRLAISTAYVVAVWGPLNGLAVEGVLHTTRPFPGAVVVAWAAVAWLAVAAVRQHRGNPGLRTRQKARWLLYGMATSCLAFAIGAAAFGTGATLDPDQVDRHMTGHLVFTMAGGAYLLSVAAAWLLPSEPDPDTLIRRTVVYGTLSAIGVVATVAFVVLPALLYFELGVLYFLVLVAVWAFAAGPTQQFVQRTVNRLMYGRRDEPMAVLTALGERLELGSPETVLAAIVETVGDALKLPAVRILSIDGSVLASQGASDLEPVVAPIIHQGEQVGSIAAWPRARDEALHENDREILRLVALQAGPTVSAVRLNQELRRSRQEILEGREEERLRIVRDLHDGLGPALAAIAMQADTARAVIDQDPAAAKVLLGAVTEQARDVVHEVRRLVYDLRPPALDQLGLVGAIDSLVRQHSSAGLAVEVRAGDLPAVNAAGEVAVYRIVSEALNNVSRHSGASGCVVSLEGVGGEFRVAVEDDGQGIDPSAPPGIGLRSMAERAAEIGGRIEVSPAEGGGTRVVLTLPIAEPTFQSEVVP